MEVRFRCLPSESADGIVRRIVSPGSHGSHVQLGQTRRRAHPKETMDQIGLLRKGDAYTDKSKSGE